SSRRRHTRWPRDWSSDVCSSDLREPDWEYPGFGGMHMRSAFRLRGSSLASAFLLGAITVLSPMAAFGQSVYGTITGSVTDSSQRSEERRVGKEGRSRWSPDQYRI